MPIDKVAVIHKFGIISHTQRLELQERLLKQSYLQTQATKQTVSSGRNPLEVSEDFVQQFNSADSLEVKEVMEETAFKMLERIKRRAGIKGGGLGVHVDLPVAWTELSQLAQCKGKIQEDCLDLLVSSLEQAPIDASNVPALFFLAETALYWLRTDAIQQPYLRTGEIKLLRMGQLVFSRLFFHHMSGRLQQHEQFKNRLFTYLDGFSECQEAYNPYPNALLCICYINEVGHIVIGDSSAEDIGTNENEPLPINGSSQPESQRTTSDILAEKHDFYRRDSIIYMAFREVSANYSDTHSHTTTMSSTVHDLSPTLWHSLDVWRCINQLSGGLTSALQALAHCGMGLKAESWVDATCAMQILADAACSNLNALRVMQNLAKGISPRPIPSSTKETHLTFMQEKKNASEENGIQSADPNSRQVLSDIYEKSEEAAESLSQRKETMLSRHPETTNELTKRANMPCAESKQGAQDPKEKAGLQGWRWEIAVTYTELITDIVLHGRTSNIQKIALIGNNKDVSCLHRYASQPASPLKSAGLLDLIYLNASAEETEEDWTWKVRYSAMQGLVKICRCYSKDTSSDGVKTVAWNSLLQAHSLERDRRVLEAIKIGQVDATIETILSQHINVGASSLGGKIAGGLSQLYLPALPPPVQHTTTKKKRNPPRNSLESTKKSSPPKPLRTSLREEIQLATALHEPPPGFQTRTEFDLKRVVEDQWRKELQQTLLEEEDERKNELDKKQQAEEEQQRMIEEKRKQKLGSKYRGPSYQIKNTSCTKLNKPSSQKINE